MMDQASGSWWSVKNDDDDGWVWDSLIRDGRMVMMIRWHCCLSHNYWPAWKEGESSERPAHLLLPPLQIQCHAWWWCLGRFCQPAASDTAVCAPMKWQSLDLPIHASVLSTDYSAEKLCIWVSQREGAWPQANDQRRGQKEEAICSDSLLFRTPDVLNSLCLPSSQHVPPTCVFSVQTEETKLMCLARRKLCVWRVWKTMDIHLGGVRQEGRMGGGWENISEEKKEEKKSSMAEMKICRRKWKAWWKKLNKRTIIHPGMPL